jgi:ADP-heptose:LPS heptosyltransferase
MAGRIRPVAVPPGGFKRVAVLRLSSLGDVILTLPVVRALASRFPQARIDYWVKEEYRDAVRFDRAIHHVRALERDARRLEDVVSMSAELEECDLIVDLHGSSRTRILCFRQKAPVLRAPSYRLLRERWVRARWSGPKPTPHALARYGEALRPIGLVPEGVPHVEAGEAAEDWAVDWLGSWTADQSPVALCPGARHFTKRWPEAHWVALVERLAKQDLPVVAFAMPAERNALPDLTRALEAHPRARWCCEPLPRMAAALSRCAAAVTCDSGLMHLAAARGLRVVALFGSTAPELGFAPSGEGHVVLCRHERCQPCTLHGRARCPLGHFHCMTRLDAATVEEAVVSLAAGARV